jgi:hypothetical protein
MHQRHANSSALVRPVHDQALDFRSMLTVLL